MFAGKYTGFVNVIVGVREPSILRIFETEECNRAAVYEVRFLSLMVMLVIESVVLNIKVGWV